MKADYFDDGQPGGGAPVEQTQPQPEPQLEPEPDTQAQAAEEQRLKMIELVSESYDDAIIFQAKKKMGLPLRDNVWPPTLDAISRIMDMCQLIVEGK